MYTAEAEDRIRNHNKDDPLFLYLAYQAVHSANRPADGLQAPPDWIEKFKHIKHEGRRKFAAMLGYLDYGIGRVRFYLKICNPTYFFCFHFIYGSGSNKISDNFFVISVRFF